MELKYADLAQAIVAGRGSRRTQSELATDLGVKQQSVSRWEAGTHRPTVDQIPRLAAALGREPHELMTLAGYGVPVSAAPAGSIPVDSLDPVSFEHFVADLVEALHPGAEARVQGSSGHTQDGTDILAQMPDGTRWSLQCKRVERFGKANIDEVVARHQVKADRAFLVLSRIASPGALEAMATHKGWTLWDKQYLSQLFRRLPGVDQERLVDLYFRGQRMALLGRPEAGPWINQERFFRPFSGKASVLTHDWALVGRDAEVRDLLEGLNGPAGSAIALLIGAGGLGKSRLIKEVTDRFTAHHPATRIHFLSPTRDADEKSLDQLGTDDKLLVIDDAHDRDALGLVIEYAADPRHRARLLVASRPYAEQRLRNELALSNITDPPSVKLEPLTKAGLTDLILAVLQEYGGDPAWAESIREAASDNPLVAAMAAKVVASEQTVTELATRTDDVRRTILARFTKVITGEIGRPADAMLIRRLLDVLALIQPFHIDDRSIAELVAASDGTSSGADVTRGLKLLAEGGVIYRRGDLHRLMPDLLGDFLIEESCIGADGKLTDFALTIADAIDARQLTQLMVNLGRLDWRLAGGDPTNSRLLEPLWQRLHAITERYDPRLGAVEAVAYYQPAQALAFVEAQLAVGRQFNEFGTILRRIALSPEYRLEALGLLWELGREDQRETNPHPSHPIRVLTELMDYEPHKPLAFIEEIADFAFSLVDDPRNWIGKVTPLDLLKPLLAGAGIESRTSGRGITMSQFYVAYERVEPLRRRVIDTALELLQSADPAVARRAALFLDNAVRPPHGAFGSNPPEELLQTFKAEFKETIARVVKLVATGKLAATTLIGLVRSLRWYAEYGSGELEAQVKRLFTRLPSDLDFRLLAGLADGAEWSFNGQVPFADWSEDREWASTLAAELVHTFDDAALADRFFGSLQQLEGAGENPGTSGFLVDRLLAACTSFAHELVRRARARPEGRVADFLGYAGGALLDNSPDEGRKLIDELLSAPTDRLRRSAACSLIGIRRTPVREDKALLRQLLRSTDLASIGLTALRSWREIDDREVIALVLTVPFEREPALLEQVAMLLRSRQRDLLQLLSDGDVRLLLKKMEPLEELDGHWTGEMLSHLARAHSRLLAGFLLRRAEPSLETKNGIFRSLGWDRRQGGLGFQDSPEAATILAESWEWVRRYENKARWTRARAAELFAAMFKLSNPVVVQFWEGRLDRAQKNELELIGDLLRHAHHRFPLEYPRFIQQLLDRCRAVDREVLKDVSEQIFTAAITGGWSGTRGEPMPRDLHAKEQATRILSSLSRLSPAYDLYRKILKAAEANIARQIEEGQRLDRDEE